MAEEWQIRFKRGQEIEEIGNKIHVGLIVDVSLIEGSLTKQLDGVQTMKDLYRIPRGGEGARDRAGDFHELVYEAAEKWLTHTFLQGPPGREAVYAQLKHRDFSVQRAGLSVLRKLARRGDDAAIAGCHALCEHEAFEALVK